MKAVAEFNIPVQNVVDGLTKENFKSIAVVAEKEDGKFYIASNCSTPKTLELFVTANEKIEANDFDL